MWVCGSGEDDEFVAIPLWAVDGEKTGALFFAGDEEAVTAQWGANANTLVVASANEELYFRSYAFDSTVQWSATLESARFDAPMQCFLFDQDGDQVTSTPVAQLLLNGQTNDTLESFWGCMTGAGESFAITYAGNGDSLLVFSEDASYFGTWEMTGDDSLRFIFEDGSSMSESGITFDGTNRYITELTVGDSQFDVTCDRYDEDGNKL
ncbi:hypothetical protein Q4485_10245 [Granulosicoccaceae sp. 1_MG-2023]|nr:hypothetical protein [Granulosicoccaceae sp. 1_MG-2023]